MKFLSSIRLRKIQNQNPSSSSSSSIQTNTDDTDTGKRKQSEMEENSSSDSTSSITKKSEMEENLSSDSTSSITTTSFAVIRERNSSIDGPPNDDVCPICFGGFLVPCRAPCGHWYCGGCILEYWNHVSAFRPCKCPMCSCQITRLMPKATISQLEDAEVIEVLKNVQQYNRLFIGGAYSLLLKVSQFPLFIKRVLQGMMDPDRPVAYLGQLRLIAVFLGALYTLSPFDFLPTWRNLHAIDLLDYSAVVLSYTLYLVGLYLRRRRLRHVRQLATIQQP